MTPGDVKALIQSGEGTSVEFKRKISSPEKIARELVALANTEGGVILFGVDDDGGIFGVESEKSEIDLVDFAATQLCDPPVGIEIEVVPFDKKDVIVASVEQSTEKPHYVLSSNGEGNKVYIRVKDQTLIASKEVIKVLRDERPDAPPLKLVIGSNERKLFEYFDTHERITVKEYADLINVSLRRASRILTTLVRAGVVRIHTLEKNDYFTLSYD
ncbi:MAG: ATP-binding protein [Bacteroidota bacterium]|nr:ATP-binding protein [Bacteroidota bacterium]